MIFPDIFPQLELKFELLQYHRNKAQVLSHLKPLPISGPETHYKLPCPQAWFHSQYRYVPTYSNYLCWRVAGFKAERGIV